MIANLFRNANKKPDAAQPPSQASRMHFLSTGLKELAEYLDFDQNEKHIILDLSGACQSVLNYFCRFDCIYLVANAKDSFEFSRINRQTDSVEDDPGNYSEIFRNVLPTRIPSDISTILTWDYFNYMERHEIINLMEFLSPHCRQGAKLYAISWLTETIPSLPSQFDATIDNEIIYELSTDDTIPSPEYSAQSLVDMMPSFIPHRLSVTRSGMLEVLLEFKQLATAPNPYVIPSAKLTSFETLGALNIHSQPSKDFS